MNARIASLRTDSRRWVRRARPLLGTLVEIGVRDCGEDDHDALHAALDAAFDAVVDVQGCLSRFETDSDISRFHALHRGEHLTIRPATQRVLAAAQELRSASAGVFDISLGTGLHGWRCVGDRLHKLHDDVRLDLGGIGKGHAIDRAVQTLVERGCDAGWVNAGGDLRAFGAVDVPVHLRDEARGGVRAFATLGDGAFATSLFDVTSRSELAMPARAHARASGVHVSVAAPLCLWADALTKVVAIHRDPSHPLLERYDARAWLH